MGLFSSSKSKSSNTTNNDIRTQNTNTQANTAPVFNAGTVGEGSSSTVVYNALDGGATARAIDLSRTAANNVTALADNLLSSSERTMKNVLANNQASLGMGYDLAGSFLETVRKDKDDFLNLAKSNVTAVTDSLKSSFQLASDVSKPDQGQTKELLTVMAYAAVAIVGLIAFGKR